MNMIWHRWAVKDLVLVAVSVAAITLGFWPSAPQRQMIHCSDAEGNTRSFSLPLGDSRLARIRRELDRRQTPPPVRAVVLAKWRLDLADHYLKRCDASSPGRDVGASDTDSVKHLASRSLPADVVPASFSTGAGMPTTSRTEHAPAEQREAAFWRSVAEHSRTTLVEAEKQIAAKLSQAAPAPVAIGAITTAGTGIEGWITATLLGLLAACLFAEWTYRSPAVEIAATEPHDRDSGNDLRIEIPAQWIRIHQPLAVKFRRSTLAGLVALAIAVTLL